MQQIGKLIKHMNRRWKNMTQTEYIKQLSRVKDIHDDENPVKYWLSRAREWYG